MIPCKDPSASTGHVDGVARQKTVQHNYIVEQHCQCQRLGGGSQMQSKRQHTACTPLRQVRKQLPYMSNDQKTYY
jgi:hypothetical protein